MDPLFVVGLQPKANRQSSPRTFRHELTVSEAPATIAVWLVGFLYICLFGRQKSLPNRVSETVL